MFWRCEGVPIGVAEGGAFQAQRTRLEVDASPALTAPEHQREIPDPKSNEIMSQHTPVKVLVWDEAPRHASKEVYPNSLNGAIADALNTLGQGQIEADTANLDEPNQGITAEKLKNYDVLLWWGHARHGEVS